MRVIVLTDHRIRRGLGIAGALPKPSGEIRALAHGSVARKQRPGVRQYSPLLGVLVGIAILLA
jgi:hypothetical protein